MIQRVTGHKQALQAHNLPYDEQPIDFLEGNLVPAQPAYNIITRMLKAKIKFTGVFTASDEAAIGAIAALKDHGLRVPDDIAVVSIDNIELASMIRPALTTVDIPKHRLARFAIQSLQTQKAFPDQTPVSMMLPTKLIVRESCGAKT